MKKITILFVAMLFATLSLSAATGWYNDFLTLKVNGVEAPNNYFLVDTDPASGATAFQGTAFGSVTSLEITGVDMKYWSDTQDRTGGAMYYKVMSSDGNTEIVAPVEVIWDQAALGGNDFQGTKTTTINITNAILANGSYQLHIWAKSWGTGQGDSWLSNNVNNYVATFTVDRPVIITGANGITDNSSFETLKAAFDAINAQADQSGKDIEIQIAGSTTETATAALNQPATASWNSLTIYPTVAAVEIAGDFAGALIDLNGADNVTITGKINKEGDSKSLTIIQSSVDDAARAIQLQNDAKSNTITYCILKGSSPSSSGAVLLISDPTTDGNDMNTISYNDITLARTSSPDNFIYVKGATGKLNDNIIIDHNNIVGFFTGETAYGINFSTNNTDFTITNNSIYEPNEIIPTNSNKFYGINISSVTAENINISNNYIGGSTPMCGGLLKKSSAFSNEFNGIFLTLSTSSSNANVIDNNFIKNIEWKNTDVKKDFISVSAFGNAINIGATSGNTISDIYWENGAVSAATFYGYKVTNTTGLVSVENNTFSNITITNTDATHGSNFYGFYKSNSLGGVIFNNNTIGSTTANSINITGVSTGNSQTARGIFLDGTSRAYPFAISGNIIQNINNSSSRTDATNTAQGIYIGATVASGTITNNVIHNLTATDATMPASVIGINMDLTSTTAATICSNNMISLGNSNPGLVYGIMQNTGLAKVYHNTVYISGSPASGSFESAGLVVSGTTPGREVINNILYNARSNAGTASGKNYTVNYNATADLASDYNVVNAPGTGGLVGALGATDYITGEDWVAGTGLDTHSQVITVNFANPTTGDLTLTGASVQDINLKVPSLAAVTTDFLGTTRNTEFTYAGAHESTLPFPTTGLDKALMQAGVQISKAGIFIPVSEKTRIELYSINGTLIDKTVTNNSYRRALNNGAYIVKINGKAVKFVK